MTMIRRPALSIRSAALVGAALLALTAGQAQAQLEVAPSPASQANKTPKPAGADFTGVMTISNQTQTKPMDENLQLIPGGAPLTAFGAETKKAADLSLDPSARCLPAMPRHLGFPYPMQIVQSPGLVVMMFEAERVFRLIYTDERPHPDEETQAWLGSSIGHWEGDTLVVDTRRINTGAWLDSAGTPISEQLVLTERIRKIDGGKRLEIVLKIEDPKVFTRPIYQRYVYNYKPDWELQEYLCNEGNRDDVHNPLDGQAGSFSPPAAK